MCLSTNDEAEKRLKEREEIIKKTEIYVDPDDLTEEDKAILAGEGDADDYDAEDLTDFTGAKTVEPGASDNFSF